MKSNQSRNRLSRKPALNSISVAVLAALIASGAHAADTTFNDNTNSEVANGHVVSNSLVKNDGNINATITGANVGTTVTGTQSGNSASVTANTIAAGATGNTFAETLDLSQTMDGTKAGIVTLGRAANTGVVSTLADQNTLAVTLTGFTDGSVVNKDNTISATTVVNRGVSTIAGTVPNNYISAIKGSTGITDNNGLKEFTAAASIVSTSAQQTVGPASTATASGNTISLGLVGRQNDLNGPYTVRPSAALTGNTVSASIKGNSAASTIDIQSGGAPTFVGSAVLSNTQLGSSSSAAATNSNASILGSVSDGSSTSTLTGTLAVTGNAISSSAIGNEALGTTTGAGNRILLGDSLSFAGTGSTLPGAHLTGYAGDTALSADLVIANTQKNLNTPLTSTTSNGLVKVNVEYLTGGTVNLLANSITASATGNAASNALASGKNAASFSGSAAVASQQENTGKGVAATVDGAQLLSNSYDISKSTVSLTGNRSVANARGNETTQSLALDATTLALGTAANLYDGVKSVTATGAATVSNLQVNATAPVTANNQSSKFGMTSEYVLGAELKLNSNTQEAVALANNASNALSLNGTSVGTGAGIASVQQVNAASAVAAGLTGSNLYIHSLDIQDSTLSATNNLQRAIGYGNLVANDLGVTATSVNAAESMAPASTITYNTSATKAVTGSVVAGYGIRNDQSVLSSVSASAIGSNGVNINTADVNSSKVLNEGNAFAAAAYGNNAASALTLKSNGISSSSNGDQAFSSIANITSTQAVNAAILATAIPGTVALTSVNGSVNASTVSASGNSLESLATGSLSSNTLNAMANSIATGGAVTTGSTNTVDNNFSTGVTSTTASFSVQNVQSGQGSVIATQRSIKVPSDVRIAITGDVSGATLAADTNTSMASATSNSTINALGMNADSLLASSSALQNVQITSADVKALIGAAGTAAIAPTKDQVHQAGGTSTPGNNAGLTNGVLTVSSGTVTFSTANVATNEIDALNARLTQLGFQVSGRTATLKVGTYNLGASLDSVTSSFSGGATTYAFKGYTVKGDPGMPATPNHGGVTLAIGGSVTDSQLSVSGNATRGFAAGNRASNSTLLQGNDIATGSSSTLAMAGMAYPQLMATADHTVANNQNLAGTGTNTIDSNVYGTLAIDATPGANISGSSLKVVKNSQGASAVGNTAGNSLVLQGNSVTAVSALQSTQTGSAAVNAASNLVLFAPGGVTNSSVLVSGNTNSSLAVINDVTNTLSVSGTLVGNSQAGKIVDQSSQQMVTAEHALSNVQLARNNVSSTAITQLYNQEAMTTTPNDSLIKSTLTLSDNSTAAEASANRALNTASVTGTSTQAASVALGNYQWSVSPVTAAATTAATVGLTSGALNSTVLIDSNSTTALARGNTATNVLNSLAGSVYGTALGGTATQVSTGDVPGSSVNANAGILNLQSNYGSVLATSTAATYQVALNLGNTSGSVGVTGNQVAAQAYGNSAINSMTLNALNTSTPTAAIGNSQLNTAAITATVTSVAYGVGITGAVSNSTLRTNGNQIMATAVGNSVVSSILAAR